MTPPSFLMAANARVSPAEGLAAHALEANAALAMNAKTAIRFMTTLLR